MASQKLILAVLLLWASCTRAADVQPVMHEASETLLQMLPSLYGTQPDRTAVLAGLGRLDELFKQAAPHFEEEQAGSRVTYALLAERLDEAIQMGHRQNINLLRGAVEDAFDLCGSCHTQDRKMKRAFGISKLRELDEYLAGEFSFLTRDYESALTSFANYLNGEQRTLERDAGALDRVLVITAEVLADPRLAKEVLTAMQTRLETNSSLREQVGGWNRALARLVENPDGLSSPLGKKTVAELDSYLDGEWPAFRGMLTWPEQDVYWIVARSELNRFLTGGARGSNVPKLLYWLAVSDRALQYRFYGSLSKAYLEQCIATYPRDPYARRCLEEYEMLVLVSFSGSNGTDVPREVQARLLELRRLVYPAAP